MLLVLARSFVFTESPSLPTEHARTKAREKRDLSRERGAGLWTQAFIRLLKQMRYKLDQVRGRESRNTAFNSRMVLEQLYFNSFERNPQALRTMLQSDFETFLDEAVAWKTPWYQYDPLGVARSYIHTSMEHVGERFVTEQAKKGRTTSRAEVELDAMAELVAWMEDPETPEGSLLIWMSPRGTKGEGYLGLESDKPVKINLYLKQEEGALFRQYTTWHPNNVLPQLQEALQEAGGKAAFATQTKPILEDHATIARFLTFGPEHWLAQELMADAEINAHNNQAAPDIFEADFFEADIFDAETASTAPTPRATQTRHAEQKGISDFETWLYASEESWAQDRSDTLVGPNNELWQLFLEVRQPFVELYLEMAERMISYVMPDCSSLDELRSHPDYTRLIRSLDNVFSLCFGSVITVLSEAGDSLEFSADKASGLSSGAIPNETLLSDRVKQLLRQAQDSSYALLKQLHREQLSVKDKASLLLSSDTLQAVSQISSLAQCGIVAPFTAPASMLRAAGLTSPGLLTPTALRFQAKELVALDRVSAVSYLDQLESLQYQELNLTKVGATQIYMVPTAEGNNYLEGLGCSVAPNGEVVGPCQLPDVDPEFFATLNAAETPEYRIPLSSPLETLALPMDQASFLEFVNSLRSELAETQLSELEQEFAANTSLSLAEKSEASHLFDLLKTKLFKTSISFDEFMAGGPHIHGVSQGEELPGQVLRDLMSSGTILEALTKLRNWIETLFEETPPFAPSSELLAAA